MGCGHSAAYKARRRRAVQENAKTFKALGMSQREAERLFDFFSRVDADGSGEISLMEFLEYLDLERTPFTKRAFTIFDTDKSGEIDFREFAAALWNYCTFEKHGLCRFAHELYDLDASGDIDLDEVEVLVKEVYGKGFHTNLYARRLLEKMRIQAGGDRGTVAITKETFIEFSLKHPALLFPAFQLQIDLQAKIMGKAFWHKATQSRAKLFPTESFFDFLRDINKEAFDALTGVAEEPVEMDVVRDMQGRRHTRGPGRTAERYAAPHRSESQRLRGHGADNNVSNGPPRGVLKKANSTLSPQSLRSTSKVSPAHTHGVTFLNAASRNKALQQSSHARGAGSRGGAGHRNPALSKGSRTMSMR